MPQKTIKEVLAPDIVEYYRSYRPAPFVDPLHEEGIGFFETYRSNNGNRLTVRDIINLIIRQYNSLKSGYTLIVMSMLDLTELSTRRLDDQILPYFKRMYNLEIKRYSPHGTMLYVVREENVNSNVSNYRQVIPEPVGHPPFLQIK